MIKRLSLIVITSAMLVACSSQPKVVEVPVYSCPAPSPVPEPILETSHITEQSSMAQVLRAYGMDVPILKSYARTLRDQLRVYEKLAKENPTKTLEGSTK